MIKEVSCNSNYQEFFKIDFSFDEEDIRNIELGFKLLEENPALFQIIFWSDCTVFNDELDDENHMRQDGSFLKISNYSITILTYQKDNNDEYFFYIDRNSYEQDKESYMVQD